MIYAAAILMIGLGVLCILTFDGLMMLMGLLAFAMSWCCLSFDHFNRETTRLASKTQCILAHATDYQTVCKRFGSDAIAPFSYRKALLG